MTIIEILLEAGAQPNAQDSMDIGGNSPLHLATELNMISAVKAFLTKGGDAEIQNQLGFSCLHIAAKAGYTELVKLLVAKDVNLDQRDMFGNSAAYYAHQNKFADILEILPAPLKVTKEEYYEHIQQVWKMHDFKPGGKKKKGKKGKKKK